jgi:hypothetical protein
LSARGSRMTATTLLAEARSAVSGPGDRPLPETGRNSAVTPGVRRARLAAWRAHPS